MEKSEIEKIYQKAADLVSQKMKSFQKEQREHLGLLLRKEEKKEFLWLSYNKYSAFVEAHKAYNIQKPIQCIEYIFNQLRDIGTFYYNPHLIVFWDGDSLGISEFINEENIIFKAGVPGKILTPELKLFYFLSQLLYSQKAVKKLKDLFENFDSEPTKEPSTGLSNKQRTLALLILNEQYHFWKNENTSGLARFIGALTCQNPKNVTDTINDFKKMSGNIQKTERENIKNLGELQNLFGEIGAKTELQWITAKMAGK